MRITQDFPSGMCAVFEYDETGKRQKFILYNEYGYPCWTEEKEGSLK